MGEDNMDNLKEKDAQENGIKMVEPEKGEDMDSLEFHKSEKETNYQYTEKKNTKNTLFLIIVLVLVLLIGGGIVFRHKVNSFLKGVEQTVQPTLTPSPTAQPTPTPNPLIRSDWSFEILNGSGVAGEAKKLADKLRDLGYPVVKSGNADKDNYSQTAVFVKKELQDKIDMVIVDIKDVIKIASIAGELKDSTASARIIIGKDINL